MSSNSHELWQLAGWTMWHYSWIGAVLGIAIIAAREILKSFAPRSRYLFAVTSLAVLTLAPILTAVVIARSISVESPAKVVIPPDAEPAATTAASDTTDSAPERIVAAKAEAELLTFAELALIEQRSLGNPLNAEQTRISGIVVDEEGRPVADVHVSTAGYPLPDVPSATTDAEGVFLLDLDTAFLSILSVVARDDTGQQMDRKVRQRV